LFSREVPVRSAFRLPAMLVLLTLLISSLSGGQASDRRTTPGDTIPPHARPGDEAREKMLKDMEKRRNEDRQKQIRRDSEKLLQLATELKDYVDKSNENILSMDVIRKADEIEKYAHSVKEKMKSEQ
jgi:hypothetical protein